MDSLLEMPRSTRSSNAAKKKALGVSNSSDSNSNRTASSNDDKSDTPRKSLRSAKVSPAPSVASSGSTVSNTTATRSLRKRAPPSPEKAAISDGADFKRCRVSVPSSPEPSPTPTPVKGATPTGRKQRGPQKESSSPLTSTSKRAKVASQAPEPANPEPPPATTPSLKRRRQTVRERGSGAEEEEEEEEHSSSSPVIAVPTTKRRGAKRSRRAPRKTSAEAKEAKAATPIPTTAEKEEVKKVEKEDQQLEKGEKAEELSASSPPKSPITEMKTSLSKKELLALQRRQLLQHLDHYDLSDLTSLSSLFATWPESELRVAVTVPPSLPISASQRLWISTEGSPISRTTLNGDNHEADATPTKAAEVLGTKRARRHFSPVPRTDARGGGPGSGGLGEHEGENAEDSMEKNQHPRLLDIFCVASFTLPAWKDKDTAAGDGAQLDEHEHLVRDIAAINPDVFCVKQAHVDYATLYLRPELSRQGYQCSGGTDGTTTPFQSFIFFSREVFSEVAFHCRPVQSMARKLVKHSAYAQLWRDTLNESLKSSCAGDRSGGNASNDSQLLVSVLRHLATGSLLLVGCLTEHLHLAEFPSPPLSSSTTAVVSTATPITVPFVECAGGGGSGTGGGGCCASTITVSFAGCHSSLGGSPSAISAPTEWCPPSFDSRPDLAAINASGCLWALHEIWQEVQESGQAGSTTPLLNGYNGNGRPLLSSAVSPSPMRWVLCANLEASPSSPAYQIFRDGYPSDESIARLRAVRNVHLRNDFLDATSLLDLLWHAFQHPCTDVRSCYHSVMSTEPPFTRYATVASSSSSATKTTVIPRKCVDYIFCSGSSLHPRQVLIPPCRATLRVAPDSVGQMQHRICSTIPCAAAHETAFSLASKVGIVATSTAPTTA
uniref:Uncharacterized protein n=1 Tax=Echinococcus canadensis TaxID=519352 RepID=A0A915EYQ0_9CEST